MRAHGTFGGTSSALLGLVKSISGSVERGREHRELPCILGTVQGITQTFERMALYVILASVFCFFKKKFVWVLLSQVTRVRGDHFM